MQKLTYQGKNYTKVLWNTTYGFNPEKTMFESTEQSRHIIVRESNGKITKFGYWFDCVNNVIWTNVDRAIAFMRI